MKDVSYGVGVALACTLAGPIFAAPILLAITWGQVSIEGIIVSVLFLLFTMPIGAVLSMLPNLAGSAALGALGAHYPAVRHPLIWASVGAVMGALIGLAFVPSYQPSQAVLAMAGVGTVCALLCRRGTIWTS